MLNYWRRNHKWIRDGSRAAATSKMERFVIIVNGWKPLTIITKHSILDVAAALDPSLGSKIWKDSWTNGLPNSKKDVMWEQFWHYSFFSMIINNKWYWLLLSRIPKWFDCWLLFELSDYLASYHFQLSGLFFIINNTIFKSEFAINRTSFLNIGLNFLIMTDWFLFVFTDFL